MKLITALAVTSLMLPSSQARAQEDASRLAGTYEIISGEKNGQKIDADRLAEVKVRIGADAITTYDKDSKELYAAAYELDMKREPWRILMTATLAPADGKGTKAEGLVERDGDSVKLIYALPGGKAPTGFKTGENQQMFVMRRTGK